MDKLTMAHEYFMKHGRNNSWMESDVIDAWKYADAMQAEVDKRENKTRPEVSMAVQQTFINGIEQPRYATSMGDQKRTPKVSSFERSDAVKEVLSRAENMGLIKPKADKEWQPDWSQAPKGSDAWRMYGDGNCAWLVDIDGDFKWWAPAPSFDYQGNWQNSLRTRPQ